MTSTTREAVERLAKRGRHLASVYRGSPLRQHREASDVFSQLAKQIEAIAADNDALRAEVAALQKELKRAAEYDEYHPAYLAGARAGAWRARGEALEEGAQLAMECAYDGFTPAEIVDAIRARAGGAGDE
jgi:fatty acid/phospholipid biosynthesis enzyme